MRKAVLALVTVCAALCASSADSQQSVPKHAQQVPRVSSGAALDKTEQLLDSMLDLLGQRADASDEAKREARILSKAADAARALAALCARTDCAVGTPPR